MLSKIVTKLFGKKYYIVSVEMMLSSMKQHGNINVCVDRLSLIDIDFVKDTISERYGCNKENILILSINRIQKPDNF